MAYEITQDYTVPTGIAGTYRNGKSKPEGIVIHSSGNKKASVDSEIAYMSKNYNNAFTHAWAGHDKIVEIANTDYACWGVGSIGNQRFVQIEMTEDETLSKAQHLLVIDRAAYWGAVQLDYYGLACTNAAGGSGTVWSHDAVSKHLGGTDHIDPIAYLVRYGYTWNDMFNLIKKHYDALQGVKTATVAKTTTTTSNGIVKSYAEKGVFYPNDTIIVRDKPSTKAKVIAKYYKGENVTYHTVHVGNGYVWLEYLRSDGKSGYIPCRTYKNGKYGELWGTIK